MPSPTAEAYVEIAGDPSRALLIADHASNRVPDDIELGIAPALLSEHIASDIGVAPLGRLLCEALGCAGIFGGVSRLVADYNREKDKRGLIPVVSDGYAIPRNAALDEAARQARIARFWRTYHARIAALIASARPPLLISLHSFTPRLASDPAGERPWQVGILYNRDERAARVAIPLLEATGVVTGDNQPYSGRVLNATMNLHGEAQGIAYLGIEVRQDLIGDAAGVARWAGVLRPVIEATLVAAAAWQPGGEASKTQAEGSP